jgi:hypothetical protein
MRISEIKNNNITLKGVKNPNDDKLDVEKCLASHNHFSLFIGQAGSGKTSLIINLLSSKKFKSYRKCYDAIYFFSGSLNTLPDKFLSLLHPERIFTDLENLEETINNVEGKVLFIIDDLVKEIKEYEEILKKLIYNRRHIGQGSSLWMISQKITVIPLSLRSQADVIYFFSMSARNKKEVEALFNDFITDLDKDEFKELIKYVFDKYSEPHDFLYINKRENKYYKNFNELTLSAL